MLCLVTQLCSTLCNPIDYSLPGSSVHGYSPGKNTGVDCHILFQGVFPTQWSNPGFPHCRQMLYHWGRKWQPTPVFLLENLRDRGAWWAAVCGVTQCRARLKQLSSSSSSFTIWATREAQRILEWVAYPFSRGSSWLRNWNGVSIYLWRIHFGIWQN